MTVIKGIKKRKELEAKTIDESNYMLAIYILTGLAGNFPKEPFTTKVGGDDNEITSKNHYEMNKAKFINIMEKINNGKDATNG